MDNPLSSSNIWEKLEARTCAVIREVRRRLPWQCHICTLSTDTHTQPSFRGDQHSQLLLEAVGLVGGRKGSLFLTRAGLIPGSAVAEQEETGSNSVSPTLQHCLE